MKAYGIGVQVVDVLPQQSCGSGRGRGNDSMVGAVFIRSGGSFKY